LGMPTFSPETIGYSGTWFLLAASSVCQNATVDTGTLAVKNFGFEYIEYIGGQQITKRQVGKDLIIKCRERI